DKMVDDQMADAEPDNDNQVIIKEKYGEQGCNVGEDQWRSCS
ncbi:hypothetical protein Tco_1012206, partial [Tanacetum coccineum]